MIIKWLCKILIIITHVPLVLLHSAKGLSNVPRSPYILVANHPRRFDGPTLFICFSYKRFHMIRFLAAQSTYKNIAYRFYYWVFDAIMVEKNDGKVAFEQAVQLLKRGYSVGVFPEGHSTTVKADKVKTGAVRLSLITGAPLLPVKIVKKKIWHLTIGKPFHPSKISVENRAAVKSESFKVLDHIYDLN